jgi:hypothetical protein
MSASHREMYSLNKKFQVQKITFLTFYGKIEEKSADKLKVKIRHTVNGARREEKISFLLFALCPVP